MLHAVYGEVFRSVDTTTTLDGKGLAVCLAAARDDASRVMAAIADLRPVLFVYVDETKDLARAAAPSKASESFFEELDALDAAIRRRRGAGGHEHALIAVQPVRCCGAGPARRGCRMRLRDPHDADQRSNVVAAEVFVGGDQEEGDDSELVAAAFDALVTMAAIMRKSPCGQ